MAVIWSGAKWANAPRGFRYLPTRRPLGGNRVKDGRRNMTIADTTHAAFTLCDNLRFVAFRFWATASICLATPAATAVENARLVPPICAAADLWLVTLIEEHGEAQDVAPETLAQAFFTMVEARKACNEGQIEAAIKIYEGIRLDAATSHGE